jgi:hypothetical protein
MTRSFTTFFNGYWSPANESFPILNQRGELVGGFVVIEGPVWKCFIASRGYAESIAIGTGQALWVTPRNSGGNCVEAITLSLEKINDDSREIMLEDDV